MARWKITPTVEQKACRVERRLGLERPRSAASKMAAWEWWGVGEAAAAESHREAGRMMTARIAVCSNGLCLMHCRGEVARVG